MKYFSYLIFWIIIVPIVTKGQEIKSKKREKEKVSGYSGKKNILQIKGMVGISTQPQKPIKDERGTGNYGISLNKELEFNAVRVLTQRKSVGLVFGLSKTSMLFRDIYDAVLINNTSFVYANSTPLIRDQYFGVKYKLYTQRKGELNSVRPYWGFNLNIHQYSIDMTSVEFWGSDYDLYDRETLTQYKFENGVHKYTLAEVGVSAGINRVIGSRIILDYGVQTGIAQAKRAFQRSEGYDIKKYIENSILNRIAKFHLLKFYLSAGYIF
jgi:hypothetical protein